MSDSMMFIPSPTIDRRETLRRAEINRFVRKRYGLHGTFALHRAALGWDLIRAPLNVTLSPVFLIVRFLSGLLSLLGAKSMASWLADRKIFLMSDVSRVIISDLSHFTDDLQSKGLGPDAPIKTTQAAIVNHAEVRNAVADITTSLAVLLSGFLLFHRATPGIISLTGPLAHLRVHSTAVQDFWLGDSFGRAWYWVFPVELSPWQVIVTGIILAVTSSLITAFAGLIADPVQMATGIHRRRMERMFARLDNSKNKSGRLLAREHFLARIGDLSDTILSIWRTWR